MNKIMVVGIGPGNYEQMTIQAAECLKSCDVIVGYTVYVDLVREHFPEKEFLTTPMPGCTECPALCLRLERIIREFRWR